MYAPCLDLTTVRENTGHYHLGVDTDCLPAGSAIPKANPWVHFGKGNDNIDMQLTQDRTNWSCRPATTSTRR